MAKKKTGQPASEPPSEPPTGIRVRATRLGFHGNVRRRPGAEFTIPDDSFLGSWMERLDDASPLDAGEGEE